jgi:hypothetical protein
MKPKIDTGAAPLASIGIDIGKEVFHLVGLGADGKIAFRWKVKRLAITGAFEKLPSCIVGMEACLSAHFVSRMLRALGHAPRIIPAIYVKPFVKGQKNDYNNAEAIAEAALRPRSPHRPGEEPRPARPAGLPGSGHAWSPGEPPPSTRSARSSSSKASPSEQAQAPYANPSLRFSRTGRTRYRPEWPT